jgi:membrane fusion protein, multidrug efflux system
MRVGNKGFLCELKKNRAPTIPTGVAIRIDKLHHPSFTRTKTLLFLIVACTLAVGCSSDPSAEKGGRGARGPAQVGFVIVQPTSAEITTELGGRVTAFQMSEVRPQVGGIIRRRFFVEGALVRQGQTLYQIDPSLYQAAAAEARANRDSAKANAEATRIRAQRFRPLAEIEAISKQDYTDAAAQARQAQASVAQTTAQLNTAQINLRFTNVPAPITGRIGRSLLTEGALATVNQAEPLAVIQRLDPIYVDIQQSSADLLSLRRALTRDGIVPTTAVVRLKLEDGSDYGLTGTVEFSEAMVAANTGTVTLRARFANPQSLLLPGMFVRAVFAQALNTQAFLVPQAAVTRDPTGAAKVYIVGPGNRAVERTIVADRTDGSNWVVTRGLKAGDRVIVQGTANLKPNAPIKPVAASAAQRVAPPPAQDR